MRTNATVYSAVQNGGVKVLPLKNGGAVVLSPYNMATAHAQKWLRGFCRAKWRRAALVPHGAQKPREKEPKTAKICGREGKIIPYNASEPVRGAILKKLLRVRTKTP